MRLPIASNTYQWPAMSSLITWGMLIMKTIVGLCLLLAILIGYVRWQGYELLSVQSGSMAPQIQVGAAVLVDRDERLPRVGDIVSYTSPRNDRVVITHRVVDADLKRGVFTAKGDHTASADPVAPMQNIIGEVRGIVPLVGYAMDAVRHPLGLLLAIYAPTLAIIVAEVRRLSMHYSGLGADRYIIHPALRKL